MTMLTTGRWETAERFRDLVADRLSPADRSARGLDAAVDPSAVFTRRARVPT
jgi:hypothetical protein